MKSCQSHQKEETASWGKKNKIDERMSIKKQASTSHQDAMKDARRAFRNQQDLEFCKLKGTKVNDFVLIREPQGILPKKDYLENCFSGIQLQLSAMQTLRSLCSHGARGLGYCLSWQQKLAFPCGAGCMGMQNARIVR